MELLANIARVIVVLLIIAVVYLGLRQGWKSL